MTHPDYFPPPPPFQRDPRFHGERCDWCKHFAGCIKTPRPEQNYCAFRPTKYEKKEQGT